MQTKNAVVFGAGKIARGFIAHLLALSGYHIRFVEKSEPLVNLLRERRKYRVEVLGAPDKSTTIGDFDVLLSRDADAVADAVADAGVVFISIGGPNLPEIVLLLSAGIGRAFARNRQEALNILICENYFQPAELLRKLIEPALTPDGRQWFRDRVGLIETMVLRSTIEPTEEMRAEDPLSLKTQDLWELPCDRQAFVGGIPPITGLSPQPNFQHALIRKLFTYNAINAVIVYPGYFKGYKLLSEAANDPVIIELVSEASREAGAGLIKRYGFDPNDQRAFAASALAKYQRPEIVDPIERNARDPIRKLAPNDRLVGPARLALEEGIRPKALSSAIGAALHYDFPGDPAAVKLQAMIRNNGLGYALQTVCGIKEDSELGKLIAEAYSEVTEKLVTGEHA